MKQREKRRQNVRDAIRRRHEQGCTYVRVGHILDYVGVTSGNQISNELRELKDEGVLIPRNEETLGSTTYRIDGEKL